MAKVLIIDRHPLHSLGLKICLEEAGHCLLAMADNGSEGLELASRECPGLIIVDLDVPKLGGLDLIQRLTARHAEVPVLVLTALPADMYEPMCITAGAAGFVSTTDALKSLSSAVKAVLAGKTWFQVKALHSEPGRDSNAGPGEELTPREITVLHYLAEGYRVKQIAGELAISDRTVSTYKMRLLEKTGTHSLVELLQVAGRRGFLQHTLPPSLTKTADAEELQFNAQFDQVPFPLCLRAPDAKVLAVNQAYLDLVQVSREVLLNAHVREIGVIDRDHAEYARKTFDAAVQQRIPYMVVVVVELRGQRKVLKHSGYPIFNPEGELLGMLCASIDIGEEQQQIDTLREQAAQLQLLRNYRGRYLLEYGLEMRNHIDQLRALVDPRKSSQHAMLDRLARMEGDVARLGELVNLELGEVRLQPDIENLNSLSQWALQQVSVPTEVPWVFMPSADTAHAWVDPIRYASLLQALLLHLQHERPTRVSIQAHGIEKIPGQLEWSVQFDATIVANARGTAPIIYLALARRLGALLQADMQVDERTANVLRASITLSLPLATLPKT